MRRHLPTIAVILTVATGCDNVSFGELSLEVRPPPTAPPEVDPDPSEPERPERTNVDGPLLLAGLRDGIRATLTLVGEVDGDVLRAFPDTAFPSDRERLQALTAPGTEWILFSEGVRVGRLAVESSAPSLGYCGSRVSVTGIVELVPSAATAERLLALPARDGSTWEYHAYRSLAHVYDQRVATLQLAREAIPEHGAALPRVGVLNARKHIQAFDLTGPTGPYIAATFMNEDSLGVAPPGQSAYAMFVIGEQLDDTQERAYVWYRAVDTEGKGAPRYFDHLDWDGDGSDEILLDVLGSDRRWFAGLARRDGVWVRTFEDGCGARSIADG
jgi:hypothetical protein